MNSIFEEILEFVQQLDIIDTHEHLPPFEHRREKPTDVLREYLLHYFNRDIVSAGLPADQMAFVMDAGRPLMERWNVVEPFWEKARNTGYCRSLEITARGLYGVHHINRDTIEELDHHFQKTLEQEHFEKVLKEKSRIRVSLLNCNEPSNPEFFRNMHFTDHLIHPQNGCNIRELEKASGVHISSLDEYLQAVETVLTQSLDEGAIGFKSALAYRRSIKYDEVTRGRAEDDFRVIMEKKNFPDWLEQCFSVGKAFQDYLMHFVLRFANERHLPFQFHTGLQEGQGNILPNSDPALLCNLFLTYPNVRFDLFHIGYPYYAVMAALAKNFPNVYLDMCWAHIISPTASVNALAEWLDAVPANKICAFGGDYLMVDPVYGHQYMARINVSKSLARKVDEGVFDTERAQEVAKMLFWDNPVEIFRLEV